MIRRIKSWVLRVVDWYNISAFFLLLIAILILASETSKFDRGIQLENLNTLALQAAALCLILSALKKSETGLFFVSVLGGFLAPFWVVGNLGVPFNEFSQNLPAFISSNLQFLFDTTEILIDPAVVRESWVSFSRASLVLLERLVSWLFSLPSPTYDPVSINLVAGIGIWFISVWLFWFLIKKKVLIGFFPALILLAVVNITTDGSIFALSWVLGTSILLEAFSHQSQREVFWGRYKFGFSEAIRRKVVPIALLLSTVLVLSAGIITSPELDNFIKELRERRRTGTSSQDNDNLSQISGQDEEVFVGPAEVIADTAFGRLPNTHLIGSGPELAEIEVMYLRTEEVAQTEQRYYLRSATYDTFTLHGWLAVDKGFIIHSPSDSSTISYSQNESLFFQRITLVEDNEQGNLMFAVGEIAAADVTYYASYHTKFKNDTYTDLFATVTKETEYSAFSIVPRYGENELRNSSLDYPSWITNKYLQIPDSVPDRVYELALRLTATEPTPYDRALAIEDYLRGFEYSLELEDPPYYQDIVDYFLFELQKGYCDYFSSSMVILARAAGIPSRLVTGYVGSAYDPELDLYVITADQAHSWVEIYFTDYGWVTFEPTSSQEKFERIPVRTIIPDEIIADDEAFSLIDRLDELGLLPSSGDVFKLITLSVLCALFIFLLVHQIDLWMLRRLPAKQLFAQLYKRLHKTADRLGFEIDDSYTPLEFSELMSAKLLELGSNNKQASQTLFSASQSVKKIVFACNQSAYTKDYQPESEKFEIINLWDKLRWQLLYSRFLIKFSSITNGVQKFVTGKKNISH